MPTSTQLVYASPPSTRKPAWKRRRLNHATDSGCQPGRALADNSNVSPTPNVPSLSLYAKLSCSTCHRALSTAVRPGVADPSICSRCAAPTCAICARTCTSYTCPPSLPPTPALTRSPSPSTTQAATTPVSPKRAALALSYAAMNCDPSLALSSSIKRKKAPIDKEDGDGDGELGGSHHDVVSGSVRDGTESIVIPGCGRVVCRACCVESVTK
ncbi:hypothetical protein J3R82DRAFT_7778 [Butyriboletus roseoflavus]|nr:hypothetical protein J3R82DRAFT_7778 [Butyriboletus roseoflavus]